MDSRPFGKILGSELKEEDGTQLPRSLASLQHQLELLCSYRPEADIGVSRDQPLARPGGVPLLMGCQKSVYSSQGDAG